MSYKKGEHMGKNCSKLFLVLSLMSGLLDSSLWAARGGQKENQPQEMSKLQHVAAASTSAAAGYGTYKALQSYGITDPMVLYGLSVLTFGITKVNIDSLFYEKSNAELLQEAYNLEKEYKESGLLDVLQMTNAQDIKQYFEKAEIVLSAKRAYEQVLLIDRALSSRYNSYLKPWNWTNKMAQGIKSIDGLFQKAFVIYVTSVYASILDQLTIGNINKKQVINCTMELAPDYGDTALFHARAVLAYALAIIEKHRDIYPMCGFMYQPLLEVLHLVTDSSEYILNKIMDGPFNVLGDFLPKKNIRLRS